jgi:hypothetical protein
MNRKIRNKSFSEVLQILFFLKIFVLGLIIYTEKKFSNIDTNAGIHEIKAQKAIQENLSQHDFSFNTARNSEKFHLETWQIYHILSDLLANAAVSDSM